MAALGLDDDQDFVEDARGLLFSDRQLRMCASIPVLGELLIKACEEHPDECDVAIGHLSEHVGTGRLELFGLGPSDGRIVRMIDEIHRTDPMIGPTDTAVVACMLVDETADGLYITDPMVITSQGLKKILQRERKSILYL